MESVLGLEFRIRREDKGAVIAAADGEELGLVRGGVGWAADGEARVEGGDAEVGVAEAVKGGEVGVGGGWLGTRGVMGRVKAGAGDEMGGGVGVDGVVAAEGVDDRVVGIQNEGGDAKGSVAGVVERFLGRGYGLGHAAARTACGPEVPELDDGVDFRRCDEEVGARCIEEGQRGDGELASASYSCELSVWLS